MSPYDDLLRLKFAKEYVNLRAHKGITLDQAKGMAAGFATNTSIGVRALSAIDDLNLEGDEKLEKEGQAQDSWGKAKDSVKDVPGSFKAWTRGTVVRSWLLDLMVKALEEDADLGQIRGYVNDSGEGRWTVEEAIAHSVPLPVITAALFARFSSRQDDSPQMKAVAALRQQFGGHAVIKAGEAGVLTDH